MRAPFVVLSLLSLLSLVFLAACEHGVDLEGRITVTAEARALYPGGPQQVIVEAEVPNVGTVTDARKICDASAGPEVLSIKTFDFGCVEAGTAHVRAWLQPTSSCTGGGAVETLRFEDAPVRAEIDVPVLVHDSPGACNDGKVSYELTLAPVTP